MKFSKNYATIFLDPEGGDYAELGKVNIILSPSLYWVKKLSLKLKYVRDVKKLLPSIFEDTLPEGKYSYSVYKSGEDFFAFAYEDKKILDLIAKSGISSSNIANVYFAQSELCDVEGAIKVNEIQSLYVKDGIVVLVPCCWIEEKGALELESLKLSSHKVSLQHFGHIVDNSSLYKVGALLGVLVVLVATEYFITQSKINTLQTQKNEIFTKYKLKSTMFQNKSLLKKYQTIYKQQTQLREDIATLLSLKLKPTQKISLVNFKAKKLTFSIEGVKKQDETSIKKQLKAKKIDAKATLKDTTLDVEIKL